MVILFPVLTAPKFESFLETSGGGGPNTAIPHEKVAKYRNTASKNSKIPQTGKQWKSEKPRCSYSILLYCYVAMLMLVAILHIYAPYIVMGSLLKAFK